MSMIDALKVAGKRVLRGADAEEVIAPPKRDHVDEYSHLVDASRRVGAIDEHSATWVRVEAWAAREILKARLGWDKPGSPEQVAARAARILALKELMALDETDPAKVPAELRDSGPHIP